MSILSFIKETFDAESEFNVSIMNRELFPLLKNVIFDISTVVIEEKLKKNVTEEVSIQPTVFDRKEMFERYSISIGPLETKKFAEVDEFVLLMNVFSFIEIFNI